MSRRRYVWRVTAHYVQEDWPTKGQRQEWTNVRHYHTESAARHRAAVLSGAAEPADPEWQRARNAWPLPTRIVIERSAPVDGWTVTS